MTISQLKTAVLAIAGITNEWVRSEFGDLRLKRTWQAAYDRCSEFVAVAVDRTATAAQYSAALLVPCLCYHAGEVLDKPKLYPYQQSILDDIAAGKSGKIRLLMPARRF